MNLIRTWWDTLWLITVPLGLSRDNGQLGDYIGGIGAQSLP